jgi:hypothetical protein
VPRHTYARPWISANVAAIASSAFVSESTCSPCQVFASGVDTAARLADAPWSREDRCAAAMSDASRSAGPTSQRLSSRSSAIWLPASHLGGIVVSGSGVKS